MTDLGRGVRMKIAEGSVAEVGRFPRRRGSNFHESKYDDLRQLEAAIREAYVTKELQAQVVEAQALRAAAEARERLKDEMLKRAGEEAAKIAEDKNRAKKTARISYGLELQNAIKSKEKERDFADEIERRERRILEEVSRIIEETQESRKISEKLELADRKSREYRIFQEIKEIRLQKEAEAAEAARLRDLEYLEEVEARIAAVKKSRRDQQLARESVIEIVAKSLLESRAKRLEIDSIIADLVMEEKLLEEEEKLRKEEARRKKAREEAAAEIERHRAILEERRLRHALEEEEFAAEVMRKVLEDARVERLTLEARRRKQIEHRLALEQIIEERRSRRAAEMIRLEEYLRAERAQGEAFRKRVKEMRERLLVQHAGNVAEFIAREALSEDEQIVLARMLDDLESRGTK